MYFRRLRGCEFYTFAFPPLHSRRLSQTLHNTTVDVPQNATFLNHLCLSVLIDDVVILFQTNSRLLQRISYSTGQNPSMLPEVMEERLF